MLLSPEKAQILLLSQAWTAVLYTMLKLNVNIALVGNVYVLN